MYLSIWVTHYHFPIRTAGQPPLQHWRKRVTRTSAKPGLANGGGGMAIFYLHLHIPCFISTLKALPSELASNY